MSGFKEFNDGLFETDEEQPCRNCDKPTTWSDYISWICPECYEQEVPA